MIKVLYVSAMAERGGVEAVILNTLRGLDRSRFAPLVVLLKDGPLVAEIKRTGTETHVVESGRVRDLAKGRRAVRDLVRLIRSKGVCLVHSHNAKAHIYGGLAAALTGIPSIYHLHGVPKLRLSRDGLVSLLSVLVRARHTVACSHYLARAFQVAWHSQREIAVIHNGVDTIVPVQSVVRSVREEFEIPADAPLILMVGRLQRWKGIHVFLDAAARVAIDHPHVFFMVVGGTLFGLDADYEAELRAQVAGLGMAQSVRLVGFRNDMFRFYSAADIVVHSSIQPEPFGMVVAEALAYARPVVASDCGGPREIIENGVSGVLVRPGDACRLAEALVMLLGDKEFRTRIGRAGASRIQNHFSLERMVSRLQTIYGQLVDHKELG